MRWNYATLADFILKMIDLLAIISLHGRSWVVLKDRCSPVGKPESTLTGVLYLSVPQTTRVGLISRFELLKCIYNDTQ